MTDLLEALLEALEEREEDGDAPALVENRLGRMQTKTAPPPSATDTFSARRTSADRRAGISASGGQSNRKSAHRRGPGDLLDPIFQSAEQDALAGRTSIQTGFDGAGASQAEAQMSGLAAAGTHFIPAGSAAALERRLAKTVQPAAAARTAETVAVSDRGVQSGLDLAELDRRVERDARRYDGEMKLY